jgi:hypothetical protein
MAHKFYALGSFLFSIFLCAWSDSGFKNSLPREIPYEADHASEIRYLPREDVLQLVSLQFKNVLADIIWFNGIGFFGRRFHSDGDYRHLVKFCKSAAKLDPKAHYIYPFCGMLIAYEVGDLVAAKEVLSWGMEALPDEWLIPYLRGMIRYDLENDIKGARADIAQAITKPNVPPDISRLVVEFAQKEGNLRSEKDFDSILAAVPDLNVQAVMRKKFTEIREKIH